MSDSSVVIEPPGNNWRSDNNNNDNYRQIHQTSLSVRRSRRDQSRDKHRSKKRRRRRSASTSSSSTSTSSNSCKRKSKRSKHSHKKRRRRYTSLSSSSVSHNQVHDYGRYQRSRYSPQAVQNPRILQPEEIPNVQTMTPEQTLPRPSRDTGSDTKMETWSFDRAINEIFRLLPPELCPRSTEEHAPAKPLSGIEQLMESLSIPLLILSQSKLIENTAGFLQDKIDTEKCGRDWVCSQSLVSTLMQIKFYKSQRQYFPTDNIPPLELEASLLDLSNKGECSTPMKNLKIWEKRARKLIAINSQADLFSSAAYLCMQQQTMSVQALPRLLEAVAKSVKHSMAMSTILATEICQEICSTSYTQSFIGEFQPSAAECSNKL